MKLELILTDIELNEENTQDSTFDVWSGEENNKRVFIAFENNGGRSYAYRLTDDFNRIAKNYRHEILTYRLGIDYPKNEEVTLADVFMFGRFNSRTLYV